MLRVQAFIAIEKGFFELINDSLAEKYNLMMQIPAVCLFFDNTSSLSRMLVVNK